MTVAILHDQVPEGAPPDAADALVQARAVRSALTRLGWSSVTLAATLDLDHLRRELTRLQPAFAFNLVESLEGHGRLIHVVPYLLEALGIPYTGASAEAVFLTSNKLLGKRLLRAAGIATPDWVELDTTSANTPPPVGAAYIVKSVWEHASIGLDQEAVVTVRSRREIRRAIQRRRSQLGGDAFAEAYIHGREFNLSLLAGREGPEVLPPAEMRFAGRGPGEPLVVDYQEKWGEPDPHRYTYRAFRFPRREASLLEQLRQVALQCWACFGLRGYARVDFRVDAEGKPWVLEINTNPCLAPDAGFAAAVARAGLAMTQALERIVADGLGA